MKKLLSVLLAAVLLLSLSAAAYAETYTEGTLHYTINNESITITGCFGRDAEVTVPANIAGIPVNTIAAGAFTDSTYLRTVYLPDTISEIQSGAFAPGITVVYNSNTDHPQYEPTDLIIGGVEAIGASDPALEEAQDTEPAGSSETGSGDTGGTQSAGTGASSGSGSADVAVDSDSGSGSTGGGAASGTGSGTVIMESDVDLTELEEETEAEEAETPEPTAEPETEKTAEPEKLDGDSGEIAPTRNAGPIVILCAVLVIALLGVVVLRKKNKK